MLALSQTTGYAILALSCLEESKGALMLAQDIARYTGIPLPYLSKILHSLGQSGLIHGKRGYRGGFVLAHPASRITLMDIVEAVDGHKWEPRCLLGLEECSDERACPTHEFWKVERQRIEDELRRITLHEVARFERMHGVRLVGWSDDHDDEKRTLGNVS